MTEASVIFTPEKSKKIALARLDLLNQWKEFRRKFDNKLQADYDFVSLHNTSNSHLFEILGKISRGTLHRWKNTLNETEDYTKLIPQYKYAKVDENTKAIEDLSTVAYSAYKGYENNIGKMRKENKRLTDISEENQQEHQFFKKDLRSLHSKILNHNTRISLLEKIKKQKEEIKI